MEMSNVGERVSVVETQIKNIDEKLDDLQANIRDVRECVEDNRTHIVNEIKLIEENTAKLYDSLNKKISELENFKNKWYYLFIGAIAVIAFLMGHMDMANKLFK